MRLSAWCHRNWGSKENLRDADRVVSATACLFPGDEPPATPCGALVQRGGRPCRLPARGSDCIRANPTT